MRDTFVNLAVILCSLLTTSIFAEHNIELQPLFSESHQPTGYAIPAMIITEIPEIELNLPLDLIALIWVPQRPHSDLHLPNSASYVHKSCAKKQHPPSNRSSSSDIGEQECGLINVSACRIHDYIL
ncbi:unnamed protein product, partial [Acanthocheilonema viteae]